ncbi:MAG: hypothetical protein EXR79_16290 [Myxococcales bacterium]|nr:hypothetical protein [Myxococcales bacterium]
MAKSAPQHTPISREEIRFLEQTLAALPASTADAADGDADGLLKFGYHQNPYVRAFVKVLWSGYALARGQIADGSQRFAQARRDAGVSAVDATTAKALEDAARALEQAMAPNGTLTSYLGELRSRLLPRLWSRVCETMGLPPPRFHVIFGQKPSVSAADAEAAEQAEMRALLKVPPPQLAGADDGDSDDDDGGVEGSADGDGARRQDGEEGPGERAPRASRDDRPRRGEGGGEAAVRITVARSGGVDMAAELLMSAVSEVLKELRVRRPAGTVQFTLVVDGQRADGGGSRGEGGGGGGAEGGDRGGGGRRRRRRRHA